MSDSSNHDALWHDRLLDYVDGATDPAFEAHRESCALCRNQLQVLARLDESLRAALPAIELDVKFDKELFARIEAMDETRRRFARRRAEQEFREGIQSLSRGRRRTLAFVIPSVVAGIALAFALTGWLDSTGVTQAVVAESTQGIARIDRLFGAFGGDIANLVHITFTTLLGAGIGLLVARWAAANAH